MNGWQARQTSAGRPEQWGTCDCSSWIGNDVCLLRYSLLHDDEQPIFLFCRSDNQYSSNKGSNAEIYARAAARARHACPLSSVTEHCNQWQEVPYIYKVAFVPGSPGTAENTLRLFLSLRACCAPVSPCSAFGVPCSETIVRRVHSSSIAAINQCPLLSLIYADSRCVLRWRGGASTAVAAPQAPAVTMIIVLSRQLVWWHPTRSSRTSWQWRLGPMFASWTFPCESELNKWHLVCCTSSTNVTWFNVVEVLAYYDRGISQGIASRFPNRPDAAQCRDLMAEAASYAPADVDLPLHKATIRLLSWSPDGTRLLTGGDDKTAKLWHVPPASDAGGVQCLHTW
jgi:hypothetical protein